MFFTILPRQASLALAGSPGLFFALGLLCSRVISLFSVRQRVNFLFLHFLIINELHGHGTMYLRNLSLNGL